MTKQKIRDSIVSTVSVLAVVLLAMVSLMLQNMAEAWAVHSDEVKLKTLEIHDLVQAAESDLRGYLLTNDTSYFRPFSSIQLVIDRRIGALYKLTEDNAAQQENLTVFKEMCDKKFDTMRRTLQLQQTGRVEEAFSLIKAGVGEDIMDKLDAQKQVILDEEDGLLLERRTTNYFFQRLSIILLLIAMVLTGYSIYRLYRRIGPLIDGLNRANAELTVSINEKNREIELRKKLEERNRQLIDRLTSKNEELNHFAYIASHDLQEPLRTVDNFIEVFKEDYGDKLDEDADQYFDFITGATSRMKTLIDGLLNYSRLGKSRGAEPVDLNDLLNGVKGNLTAAIKAKNAQVDIEKMPTIHCMKVEAMQLFQNLVNNAIKYTAADVQPKVSVSAEEKEGHWQFNVADNGIGIPLNQQGKVFNMFSRLHGDGEYKGQGIGLAFCKKIVELHGGRIWLESVPGQGSTFHFTISKKLKNDAEIEQNLTD